MDKTCKECPSYCSSCKSDIECLSCIPGFKLSSAKLDSGESVQFCSEICGDGRRFEDECVMGIRGMGMVAPVSVRFRKDLSAKEPRQLTQVHVLRKPPINQ